MAGVKPENCNYDVFVECYREGRVRKLKEDTCRGAAILADRPGCYKILLDPNKDAEVCDELFLAGEQPSVFFKTGEWDAMKTLAADIMRKTGRHSLYQAPVDCATAQ
jgi:hypothetical protein